MFASGNARRYLSSVAVLVVASLMPLGKKRPIGAFPTSFGACGTSCFARSSHFPPQMHPLLGPGGQQRATRRPCLAWSMATLRCDADAWWLEVGEVIFALLAPEPSDGYRGRRP